MLILFVFIVIIFIIFRKIKKFPYFVESILRLWKYNLFVLKELIILLDELRVDIVLIVSLQQIKKLLCVVE